MVVWWDNIWISWLSLMLSKKLVQDKNAENIHHQQFPRTKGYSQSQFPWRSPVSDGNLTGVRKLAECLKGHVNMGSSQSSLVIWRNTGDRFGREKPFIGQTWYFVGPFSSELSASDVSEVHHWSTRWVMFCLDNMMRYGDGSKPATVSTSKQVAGRFACNTCMHTCIHAYIHTWILYTQCTTAFRFTGRRIWHLGGSGTRCRHPSGWLGIEVWMGEWL